MPKYTNQHLLNSFDLYIECEEVKSVIVRITNGRVSARSGGVRGRSLNGLPAENNVGGQGLVIGVS
jgi:hypothetical protein